jgi:hypothetical protein
LSSGPSSRGIRGRAERFEHPTRAVPTAGLFKEIDVLMRTLLGACALGLLVPLAAASPPGEPPNPTRLWRDAAFLAPFVKHGDPQFPWPESARMLAALLEGKRPGAGTGWFGPSQVRYGWAWLRAHCDADGDGRVTRKELTGAQELFDRLDRDRDGGITAEDFDWSPSSPYLRQLNQLSQLFRQVDRDGNGRITEAEWQGHFKKLAAGRDHLTQDDLRALLSGPAGGGKKPKGGQGGSNETMVRAFLTSDVGSPYPGPRVGELAPDFTLPRQDGKGSLTLSEFRGKKPVVLIFGSFT